MYRTGTATVLLCLALGLASCGGGASTDGTTSRTAAAGSLSGTETKVAEPGVADDRAAANGSTESGSNDDADQAAGSAAAEAPCQARLGNFVDRMTDLRQSLLAGLSYDEYVVRVKAIGDAYREVPVDRLGADCLSGPAGAAEDAFNQYLRAANIWGDCAGTAGCAAGEIEGKLQRRWRIASKILDTAQG